MKKRVLVVDDDAAICDAVSAFLDPRGYEVIAVGNASEAQIAFRSRRPDAAVVDFVLPDGDALVLLERFRAVDAYCPVIVLTGHGSIGLAVEAIQHGAAHFLTKPVDLAVLVTVLERALHSETLRRKDAAQRVGRGAAPTPSPFVGVSAAVRILEERVRRLLESDSPVLLTGETGTGKGVLAHWIHEHGPRSSAPFVDLNCAGLSHEFLDTELFGHDKGAFTGAVNSKAGLFEIAHGGTMFLDEIGDVDLHLQPKLLKVVEEKRFRRLGEVSDRTVDVRLIGATNRNLAARAASGEFRTDLFFRISTFPLHVPALRDRVEDIPILASSILEMLGHAGRRAATLSPSANVALQRYPWTGNVRELRNVLERALLLTDGDVIDAADLNLTPIAQAPSRPQDLSLTLEQVECQHIRLVLNDERGHIERAAERLGISRSSLYNKVRQYGIHVTRA